MSKEQKEIKFNKKLIPIIAACVVLVIILFLIFGLKIFDKKKEVEEPEKNEPQVVDYAPKYVGIYSNGNIEIYLFPLATNKIFYTIDGNGYYEGVVKSTESGASDENFTIALSGDGVELTINNKEISVESGKYDKIDNYSKESFYTYNIGPSEYLTSEYTAQFKNDKFTINMVQISEDTVEIEIRRNTAMNLIERIGRFSIQNDRSLIEQTLNESDSKDKIIVDNKKIELRANNTEDKEYEGSYTKEKELTIDDIINDKFKMYIEG